MKSKISVIGCLFVFSAVLMLFASCGKDENDEPKNPGAGSGSGEKIEYYVKYACKVSGKVTNVKIMIVTDTYGTKYLGRGFRSFGLLDDFGNLRRWNWV